MRKYYIFLIDSYVIDSYITDTESLYKIIKKLHNSKLNIKYKLSIYDQIINHIDKDVITNYIENKYDNFIKHNNKYLLKFDDEICLTEIKHSCAIVISNKNYSNMFNVLKIYNKNFFICDFENEDYFFIDIINNLNKKHI